MVKIKKYDGFMAFRTTKKIETDFKDLCTASRREVSETLNYLCRLFLEDKYSIRTNFLGKPEDPPAPSDA